jgi:hypothetical protein
MEAVQKFSLVLYLMTITNRGFELDTLNLVHMNTLYSTVCKVTMMSMASIKKMFRGADNSLAQPGRKQATTTEDFDIHISYLSIYLYFFHISHLGTYHGNGKCHIQYTSSGNLQML